MNSELAYGLTAMVIILIVAILAVIFLYCRKKRSPQWYPFQSKVQKHLSRQARHGDVEKGQHYIQDSPPHLKKTMRTPKPQHGTEQAYPHRDPRAQCRKDSGPPYPCNDRRPAPTDSSFNRATSAAATRAARKATTKNGTPRRSSSEDTVTNPYPPYPTDMSPDRSRYLQPDRGAQGYGMRESMRTPDIRGRDSGRRRSMCSVTSVSEWQ